MTEEETEKLCTFMHRLAEYALRRWARVVKVHELTCDSVHFQAVVRGKKTFELRLNDRDFKVGDRLVLVESVGGNSTTDGPTCTVEVTHILGESSGLISGWVCMSIGKVVL